MSENFRAVIKRVADTQGITQKKARAVVDAFLDEVVRETVAGDRFAVPHFGVFRRRARKGRVIRNPTTKQLQALPATASIGFRMAKPGRFQRRLDLAPWATEPVEPKR